MNLAALELNDSGILATRDSGTHTPPNPGVALIEGRNVVVGREAADRTRVKPRRIHNRFWQQLDTEPLRRPFPAHFSAADLVHQHLTQIWSEVGSGVDSVILAVPGNLAEQQLGLLLGVARATGIPVTGMIDAAVAAVSELADVAEIIHMDMSLHTSVLTVIRRDRRLVRHRVEVDTRAGLAELYDRWAKSIAADFLRATRFDPLHLAGTEQSLFDRLPGWLLELATTDHTPIAMEAGGRRHTIEISRRSLAAAVKPQYDRLADMVRSARRGDEPCVIALSNRIAALPEIAMLAPTDPHTTIVELPIGAANLGAIRYAASISSPGDALPFITDLPTIPEAHGPVHPPVDEGGSDIDRADRGDRVSPTHIVVNGVAHAISDQPFVLGIAIPTDSHGVNLTDATGDISHTHCSISRELEGVFVTDHSTSGTFLNGEPVTGTAILSVGDSLQLGTNGISIELISVVD